jgi:hypothetical protein
MCEDLEKLIASLLETDIEELMKSVNETDIDQLMKSVIEEDIESLLKEYSETEAKFLELLESPTHRVKTPKAAKTRTSPRSHKAK